ncbi:TonB-dependent receptor [Alkalitalea saponilacus]|uniref:Iron complex outermembrane recepter protein n=1 Tax=Alkalitalea saponilacus TaxID=889453 RepID=A0A1T5CDM1_9BACT|nr:TonB-dependent receptor [Alkalitalea saponilacus]ASB49829.1 TonB-dependent receptor [Alkalitalea saponilacus]SKB57534.1 iron complex outermembrane recepter protein [Alkalitalea saponilacus]
MRIIVIILFALQTVHIFSQDRYHIAGLVLDENNMPVPGSYVQTDKEQSVTDDNGRFVFNQITAGQIQLSVSFMGYETFDTLLMVNEHKHLRIRLTPDNIHLHEVKVRGNNMQTAPGLNRDIIYADQLERQFNGTLVRSLERQSGFNAMDIGAAASKPVIRGMGFNRVVVVNNGLKQEGQQWGADHGLEIDPFLSEQVEIIKGAASLEHGSDAIGGILEISNRRPPTEGISGSFHLLGKTVNETVGGSLLLQGRQNRLFFKSRITLIEYGDYRVPTDSIVYLTRNIPIHNRKLKNSAGHDYNLFFQTGYLGEFWRTSMTATRVWQKSGFFPGAHGIPDLRRVEDDGNSRNIDMPYQNVEHLSITSNTTIHTPHSSLMLDLGVQNNHRQERAEFHTHFGNQPPPQTNPDLELDFNLTTYSANGRWNYRFTPIHAITSGIQTQWQKNKTNGYAFLLPDYERTSAGGFIKYEYEPGRRWKFNGGIRYDLISLKTEGYFDPILQQYMINQGRDAETADFYARRSFETDRQFNNYSWLIGATWNATQSLNLSMNLGESFRAPTAIELGANGVHHGSFRHELGDPLLTPERGFFTDITLNYKTDTRQISVSPYFYHFSNYIFLRPSGEWSHLPHTGQIFRFSESEAIMSGVEFSYFEEFHSEWQIEINAEWLYNQQIAQENNAAYPLPFSPPANGFIELTRLVRSATNDLPLRISLNSRVASSQNRIARNEKTTPGYILLGSAISVPFKISGLNSELNITGHNLLNKRYYNHISFYRNLEIPEPGRNIQLLLKIEF